jgi:Amt family ammonium transporter
LCEFNISFPKYAYKLIHFKPNGGNMRTVWFFILLALLIGTTSASEGQINAADNAWVMISAALVLIMIPGVGFFYGGMVRRKNAISTIIFSFAIMGIISLQWILFGYTLAFGKDKVLP